MNKTKKKLNYEKLSAWNLLDEKKVFDFSEGYKKFLKKSKTERLCFNEIKKKLDESGFKDISKSNSNKFYKTINNKAIIAGIVGENNELISLIGSHIDSPRIDLKPQPLYEDSDLALFKSHYYGGIKKYQWVTTPLQLEGVVSVNGKVKEISIGGNTNDPKFIISDLLPHLAKNQMEKNGKNIIESEDLNIILGNIPVKDKKIKEKIKQNILINLNKKYGIVEEDFSFAELEFVPAHSPEDIGFDRSMVGGYGQDDRVCVYSSLMSLINLKKNKTTAIVMFVDKEEIGSLGNTGAASFILENFIYDYISKFKLKTTPHKIFENCSAISGDVTAALDPSFKDVSDIQNASVLGCGVSIEKYCGSGGKFGTNDTSSEYMSYIRELLKKNKVPYQVGELGKPDLGGGGTISMFMSRYGMNVVDAGPCVLGMHSPFEIVSKVDIYSSYLLYKSFLERD